VSVQPTVIIVEDDCAYAESLTSLVTAMGFRSRVHATGRDFLDNHSGDVFGCILLDLKLPDIDGLTVLESLRAAPRLAPVIVLTGHADVPSAVKAMRIGVVAYLQKQSFSETALWEAIHQAIALDGKQRETDARRDAVKAQIALLNEPELEVLKLLVAGHDHTTVAEQLQVSRRTVENRRARLMKKLGVSTFPELVQLAMEGGAA
jgi:two-component system, LuxR family, response regulator FixJ